MPLIPLHDSDRDHILAWRNIPEVRRSMYTRHEIRPEGHRAWFEHMRADPRSRWYLYRDRAGELQGVVNFTEVDPELHTAFFGFYIQPEVAGGTGMRMLLEALDRAFDELGLEKVMGEVIAGNETSLQLYRRCAFTHEGTFRAQYFDGEARRDVLRMGLLAGEWMAHRDRVHERIKQLDHLAAGRDSVSPSRIVMLSDSDSWCNIHIPELVEEWSAQGHHVVWTHEPASAEPADFCFCLGLGQMVPRRVRARYRHTLVVHASHLPEGRGWSPLTWQVLEGADRIPVSLLEAVDEVDAGRVYLQEWFELAGDELIDELRQLLWASTRSLCQRFVEKYPRPVEESHEQFGEPTWYPRRRPADSELDPQRPLAEQFNLLRVVDNDRYPLWFRLRGRRYVLHVEKASD